MSLGRLFQAMTPTKDVALMSYVTENFFSRFNFDTVGGFSKFKNNFHTF